MREQVITVRPDGQLSGLQVKPDQGVDLRQFGHASIKRASEVLFCENQQKWYVEFREAGIFSGKVLTVSMLCEANATKPPTDLAEQDTAAYFDDYELAVTGEIQFLNYVRLRSQLS